MPPKSRAGAAGAELAQGTPVAPAAPAVPARLVRDEAGRYGLAVSADEVVWIGQPVPCHVPLMEVGHG